MPPPLPPRPPLPAKPSAPSLLASAPALPPAAPPEQSDWLRLASSFSRIESQPRIPLPSSGASPHPLPQSDWGCMGRQTLLATLQTSLHMVRDHHVPHALALFGPAKVGKTCVIEHFLAGLPSAAAAPFALIQTSTVQGVHGEGVAHLPGRLLSGLFNLPAQLSPEACLERLSLLFYRYHLPAPDLAGRTTCLHALGLATASGPLPAHAVVCQRLLAVLPALLTAMCRQVVLVIWVDDFDRFDLEDRRWLMALLGMLPKQRVLALLASQSEEGLLEGGWRGIEFVFRSEMVGGLERGGFEELVAKAISPLGVGDVPAPVMQWLVAQCEGVPGRLREHLQRLADSGVLVPPQDATTQNWRWRISDRPEAESDADPNPDAPHTHADEGTRSQEPPLEMLAAHIEDLTPESLHVLRLAALMRDPFPLEDVLALLRLSRLTDEQPWFDDPRPPWLQQQVRELIERGLLRRADIASSSRITWTLTHPDLSSGILRGMDAALIRAAHACLSRVLTLRQAPPITVAHHLLRAGLDKQAASLLLEHSRDLPPSSPDAPPSAFTRCLELQTQALALLGPEDGDTYLTALGEHGALLRASGQASDALPLFSQQLQVAFALNHHAASLASYLYQSACLLDLGLYPDARRSLERCLDLSERPDFSHCDPTLALCAKVTLGAAIFAQSLPRACAESLKLVEPCVERLKLTAPFSLSLLDALLTLALLRTARAELHQAASTLDDALAIANDPRTYQNLPKAPAAKLRLHVLRCRLLDASARVCICLGQHPTAGARLKQATTTARALGLPLLRSLLLTTVAELSIDLGDHTHALRTLRRAHEMSSAVRDRAQRSELQCKIARAHAHLDQLDESLKHCERALQLAHKSHSRLAIARAALTHASVLSRLSRTDHSPPSDPLKIRDLFLQAIAITEDMGHWLDTALCLHAYATFLSDHDKTADAQRCISRARALAPDFKPPKPL